MKWSVMIRYAVTWDEVKSGVKPCGMFWYSGLSFLHVDTLQVENEICQCALKLSNNKLELPHLPNGFERFQTVQDKFSERFRTVQDKSSERFRIPAWRLLFGKQVFKFPGPHPARLNSSRIFLKLWTRFDLGLPSCGAESGRVNIVRISSKG